MTALCLFALLERFDYYLGCAVHVRRGTKAEWAARVTLERFELTP